METINTIRERIKYELDQAFLSSGKQPLIEVTSYPATEAGNISLETEAKGKADNGLLFIGRDVRIYNEQVGGIYTFADPYLILIYSNNKNGDSEINELLDIARETLGKFMKLHSDYVIDLVGYNSGLYLAWIRCFYEPAMYGV
jgi:hypothetical protein